MRRLGLTRWLLASLPALTLAAYVPAASADPVTFNMTGAFVSYIIPTTGLYDIVAFGAQGGSGLLLAGGGAAIAGGLGAEAGGDFQLSAGQVLTIAVGEHGHTNLGLSGGGGGGGSFVVLGQTPLVIAGGGGGTALADTRPGDNGQAGTSGSGDNRVGGTNGNGGDGVDAGGGGGFYTNGGDGLGAGEGTGFGGGSYFDGLYGGASGLGTMFGSNNGYGGFGGGGGGSGVPAYAGGGGGGYSGGAPGGGGGSFNGGLTNSDFILLSGQQSGNGLVTIDLVSSPAPTPEPSSVVLLGTGLLGIAGALKRRLA